MPYTPTSWEDSPSTDTPINAANLNHLETQYAQAVADSAPRLADPNADRIYFWDDSAGAHDWLTPSSPLAISGTNLQVSAATTSAAGAVELADNTETQTGSDGTRAVTPASLASLTASTTRAGLAETATVAETITGTDTSRYVTPEGVERKLNIGFRAVDHGLVSWAFDAALLFGSQTMTSGSIYLTKLLVPQTTTITKIHWIVGTATTVVATAGQNFVGILDSNGVVLQTAGVDADITTTGSKSTTISSQSISAPFIWVAFLFNYTGTLALFRGASPGATAANLGLTASTARNAINGTSQTSITNRTPASNSLQSAMLWTAVGN